MTRSISRRIATAIFAACAVLEATPVRGQTGDPIVLYASDVTVESGLFSRAPSASGAGGLKMTSPDTGWDAIAGPLAQPAHYFEATFSATAGVSYHVWLRLRAAGDSKWNDSVWVQFDQAVDAGGNPLWRSGSTSALLVNLEDCVGCGVASWGWQDNGSWTGQQAVVRFAATGPQRIRVQLREDGVDVDQVVLSSALYTSAAPGAPRNDTTIVAKPSGATNPALTLTRQPFLQQVTAERATIVFATAGAGRAAVRLTDSSGNRREVEAVSTPVPAEVSGGAVYYQHEAVVAGLRPGTRYRYAPVIDGIDLATGDDVLESAPSTGTGVVRFLAFGDSGVGSAAQRQLAGRMAGEPFDLLLHTGDLAYGYPGGYGAGAMPQLQQWFFDIYRDLLRTHPVFPSIGNHDDEAQQARPYRSAFVLPENGADAVFPDHAERYYSFDYGPAHIVVLDTELAFQDAGRRAAQLAWLTADLATTRQPWKLAVFHRAPYSAGGEHGSDLDVRAAFEPVLSAGGVTLVLSGHEHTYERTRPQVVAAGRPGITYVVTGGGGAPLYPAATAPWTAASASVFHYLRGRIDVCRIALDAVAIDGRVFDSMTLDRCGTAYGATPATVPGTIQAEDFDHGGEGVAYHDLSVVNEGQSYRSEGVDIEVTADGGGGHNVGWLWPGEWLTYTVSVEASTGTGTAGTAGTYDVWARVSSPGQGGTFTLSVDGVPVPGRFDVPATGGWQSWQTIRGPRLTLTPGPHVWRFDMQAAGEAGGTIGNLNYFTVVPVTMP